MLADRSLTTPEVPQAEGRKERPLSSLGRAQGQVAARYRKAAMMAPLVAIGELAEAERMLLGEALKALRQERAKTWNLACDAADAQGKKRSSLRPYAIGSRAVCERG